MSAQIHQILLMACCFCSLLTARNVAHAQPKDAPKPQAEATANVPPPEKLSAEDRIRQALAEPTSLDFQETPLNEAMSQIERQHGILVRLDLRGLDDAGIEVERPITFKLAKVSLRSALNLMFRNMDLRWIVRDEVLWITTPEVAENFLNIKVYDVSDLVVTVDGDGKPVDVDFDPLLQVMKNTVVMTTWDDVGGPGSATPFLTDRIGVIVVCQTDEVHELIEKLLADLRRIRGTGAALPKGIKLRVDQGFGFLPQDPEPIASANPLPKDLSRDAVVEANNDFAFDAYQKLHREHDDNLCFSPYSISSALAMAYAGAKGETASEIAKALRVELASRELHAGSESLRTALPLGDHAGRHQLVVANRLWGHEGHSFLAPFLETTRQHYGAELVRVNFKEPEKARRTINHWVEEQTAGKIKDLLPPDFINDQKLLTLIVLTNAVYFKGDWQSQFKINSTRSAPFYVGAESAEAQLMNQQGRFKYAAADGVQVLELPYAGQALSMMILLPGRDPNRLKELESSLSSRKLKEWTAHLRPETVNVYLPRFEFTQSTPIRGLLESLGMRRAFQMDDADFSAMTTQPQTFLSAATHKAHVKVDEKGTEAAAATAFGALGGFGPTPKPKIHLFRADHPFLFLIRDNRTGCILFLGRVSQPDSDDRAS